ncbi:solute carrier family 3 member 2b [Brienomyrus brachyistius]|uniref:solute carrier family 3 member 2b n=1 Tax=Brienomyrus brachyistius TaxID=42636 RepID=UPI0020B2128C|nr:solute carrier family 3 member 2b [Brienomyrus brachyistius]
MSKDTELDMKDVALNDVDPEKQPMTDGAAANDIVASPTGTEKNGCVKVKIPEENDAKFTGLSKEELLKVAGTPGWVRTRWALLVLFWLGWLGMLAGAIVIIVQAPRCEPLPALNWWNLGPLYQVGDVAAFTEAGNLKGVEEKMDALNKLKVKGLVLGPIHVANADKVSTLEFGEIAAEVGTLDQFKSLIHTAHKKGISVVLDLTPNYHGKEAWFANVSVTNVAEKLKSALVFWLDQGVDGVQLSGVDRVSSLVPSLWKDIRAIVQMGEKRRLLIGVVDRRDAMDVSNLLNSSEVDLLLSGVLQSSCSPKAGGGESYVDCEQAIQELYSAQTQTQLAWNLGGRVHGHLASLVGSGLVKLTQVLLFALPGTPVFNYGDEIGLEDQDTTFPRMHWDSKDANETTQDESLFKDLSELRGKERSLIHGDFSVIHSSNSTLAFLRHWDQSSRYLAVFNWAPEAVTLKLTGANLPTQATVQLSTDSMPPKGSTVQLAALELGPQQAVLLSYPYSS